MNVLLVYPEFPLSYWGGQYALRLVGKRAASPPLGLITVAAMLPPQLNLRLVDMNVEPLRDEQIRWADLVMLSAMLIQRPGLVEVAARCRRLGRRTVAGGPYPSSCPDQLAHIDHLVLGEAESSLPPFLADLSRGWSHCQRVYVAAQRPDVTLSPVPRYDLLRSDAYASMAMQFSRGCPFNCEFCDIIELYGRRPRTKTPAQMVDELDALHATGFRGLLFLVDDNFVGNRKKARDLLPGIAAWQREHGTPFDLYTEASVDLAREARLMELMVAAGFSMVFVGIETPSRESLEEAQKYQNLRMDLIEAVKRIIASGLEVAGGFIVGFDRDDETIFDQQIAFVEAALIRAAMVGILNVPPNTQLERRLRREGRMLGLSDGDAVGIELTNFRTKMDPELLRRGYARILSSLYQPGRYFERCLQLLDALGPRRASQFRRRLDRTVLRALLASLYVQGIRSGYRRDYWRFMARIALSRPSRLGDAFSYAVNGHHFFTFTEKHILPRLMRSTAARPGPSSMSVTSGFGEVPRATRPVLRVVDDPAGQ